MKNQNDLIIMISVGVVAAIVAVVIIFTAPQPTRPADPTAVDTSAPKFPPAAVTYTDGLAASNTSGGGFPGMGMGMGMGRGPGMGGPGMGGGRKGPMAMGMMGGK